MHIHIRLRPLRCRIVNLRPRIPLQKILVTLIHCHIQLRPVIQPRAPDRLVRNIKPQRFNQMQPRPRRHTRPSDVACICRNLRLMKNNIQMCHFANHSCRIFKPYLPTRYISSICGLSRYRTSSPFRRILSFPDVVRPITADGIPSSAIFCTSPSPSAAAISSAPVESI